MLGLEPFWFVVRLIHILGGVAWVGGVFSVAPSLRSVSVATMATTETR